MRLGIFGGTFDPVHYGHLLLAEQCREQLALDQVWFVPAAAPPHKPDAAISPAKDRLDMLRLATSGHPAFIVSDREVLRGGTSYTVETLAGLHDEDPARELFLLIGADSLADLPTWREPRRILQLATVVGVNRGRGAAKLDAAVAALGEHVRPRLRVLDMPGIDHSASDLRRRAASGRSIRYMTPRAVEQYILEHHLYSDNSRDTP
jgi:nicotinate-nucleotide adenylyltransferase